MEANERQVATFERDASASLSSPAKRRSGRLTLSLAVARRRPFCPASVLSVTTECIIDPSFLSPAMDTSAIFHEKQEQGKLLCALLTWQ
jgi:hypothetical protein